MQPLKVRKIGNSLGLVLPKEALANLNVKENDMLYREYGRGVLLEGLNQEAKLGVNPFKIGLIEFLPIAN